jgi:hypothetical protein
MQFHDPARRSAGAWPCKSGEPRACVASGNSLVWLRIRAAMGVLSGACRALQTRPASLHETHLRIPLAWRTQTDPWTRDRGKPVTAASMRSVGTQKCHSVRAPPTPRRTLRRRTEAPHSTCPRTSRETLRRRNGSDCLMGGRGGDEDFEIFSRPPFIAVRSRSRKVI